MNVKHYKRIIQKKYDRKEIEKLLENIEEEISFLWAYMDALAEEGMDTIPDAYNAEIGLRLAKVYGSLKAASATAVYKAPHGEATWNLF